jgi:TetR/AcrR family transcriptional regulator, fatty acid metabolism regulator protein
VIDTIAEVGFAKSSVDQIAKRVGVSKGVITYHFPNKEEIVDAVVEKVIAAGRTYMQPRIMAETSAAGRLRAYIESNLEFIDAHRKPLIALVEIAMNARRADGSLVIGPQSLAQRAALLEELLRAGQRSGEFRRFNMRVMALTIIQAIDGVPFFGSLAPQFRSSGPYRRHQISDCSSAAEGKADRTLVTVALVCLTQK